MYFLLGEKVMNVVNSIPLEEIKDKVDVYEYIKKYYPQYKTEDHNSLFKMICPWHEEKTPSLVFWKKNKTFKCFGCNEHGDIINFVQKMENLDFKSASALVAKNIGVEYMLKPPNPYHEEYKNIMTNNMKRYNKNLYISPALNYLVNDRKLTKEIIQEFNIGFVPNNEYKIRTDIGGISGRISFPIMEQFNSDKCKCIGMGYRTMVNEKPKYINDRNRSDKNDNLYGVFIKGNCLYGYDKAAKFIKSSDSVYIVEGYMDVISMHQSGIKNTVGIMGTSLTQNQINLITKLTNNVILFLDSDNAGISNMVRLLPLLLANNINVKIVTTNIAKDPGDLCKFYDFSKENILKFINYNMMLAVQYVIDSYTKQYEKVMLESKKNIMNSLAPIFNNITNKEDKEIYTSYLKHKIML